MALSDFKPTTETVRVISRPTRVINETIVAINEDKAAPATMRWNWRACYPDTFDSPHPRCEVMGWCPTADLAAERGEAAAPLVRALSLKMASHGHDVKALGEDCAVCRAEGVS